ncbi:hypothetical protein L8S34_09960 [Enterobacter roggenkampii]|uniref:hypothetical protein n=1 Tax=Enterobacter roggenkampii TaxID=1812935 RepID=UPI0020034982|nr:hypothetical protein [Enterobacter roggenkampii]MCK6932015.1 hypothetical protein [Enterobacter roggenkampii]
MSAEPKGQYFHTAILQKAALTQKHLRKVKEIGIGNEIRDNINVNNNSSYKAGSQYQGNLPDAHMSPLLRYSQYNSYSSLNRDESTLHS